MQYIYKVPLFEQFDRFDHLFDFFHVEILFKAKIVFIAFLINVTLILLSAKQAIELKSCCVNLQIY